MRKNNIKTRNDEIDNYEAAPSASEIDELSLNQDALEGRLNQLNDSYETLQKRWVELIEFRWVLREAGGFFDRARGHTEEIRDSTDEPSAPLLDDVEHIAQGPRGGADVSFQHMNIGFVCGVIARDKISAFERILWRSLRGNLYMNQSEIDESIVDPTTNEKVDKNVFVIFAHGKEILAKIRKISESMGADMYPVDEDADVRRDQINEVNNRINDLKSVIENTENTLHAELSVIAQNIHHWSVVVKKEKAIFQALNLFNYDAARKYLVAEGWIPLSSLPQIQHVLNEVSDRAGLHVKPVLNVLETSKTPPTYNRTNKFTLGFQTIIDAYGTAKYREINAGLPTIITFPFLFAVMFGDVGHGIIMALAAAAMIWYEKPLGKKKIDELFDMMFFGRYIILLMGVFSIYTGFLYNDMFSKSMTLFKSNWEWPKDFKEGQPVEAHRTGDFAYPFGIDWMWHGTENNLIFTNSYKMKLSIILGWAHMTYSLCLSLINHKYFKSSIDIWGNFLPGMIFFQSIFGYLVMCMMYKWSVDWYAIDQQPPSILNMLINMFLSPGTITDRLYRGQGFVQVMLLLIALVCVPWLLFLKPFYLRHEHKKAEAAGYQNLGRVSHVSAVDDDNEHYGNGRASHESEASAIIVSEEMGHEEEFSFSEEMIHQAIHTIEFCLNCISHTASYLRLWALSLAHNQLSQVLWSMTIANSFAFTGVVGVLMVVVTFAFWFCATVAILVVMEGTSAMLHALRLHWVEAMSKVSSFFSHFQNSTDNFPALPGRRSCIHTIRVQGDSRGGVARVGYGRTLILVLTE